MGSTTDDISIFTAALDRVRDAVAVVRGEAGSSGASIVYANEAFVRWIGVSVEEILGESPYPMLSTTEDRKVLLTALAKVKGGDSVTTKLVQNKGDTVVWVEVEFEPLVVLDTPHWIVFQRDVTERERRLAQEFLLDRASTLGALSSGVAHEINNPLAFVRANVDYVSEILKRGVPSDRVGELVEVLDETRIGLDRLSRVARDLRLLTMEHSTHVMEPTDVRDALQSALNLGGATVRRRSNLLIDVDEYVPLIVGNSGQLIQVFANLIINAADAVQRSGSVRVSLWSEGAGVFARVEDSGPGVSEEIAPLIFEPFFTTKPPNAGAGMGLARCREFVRDHGGAITLSTSELGGASFTVRFPAFEVRVPGDAETEADDRPKVLVIDNEPRIAQAVARLIAVEFDTTHCTDTASALAMIDEGYAYDAVVCAVLVSPLMGVAFHRELGARASSLCSRVVFVTGAGISAADHIYLQEQGCPLIRKPLHHDELVAAIQGVLSS